MPLCGCETARSPGYRLSQLETSSSSPQPTAPPLAHRSQACPKLKQIQAIESAPYFSRGINAGTAACMARTVCVFYGNEALCVPPAIAQSETPPAGDGEGSAHAVVGPLSGADEAAVM